MWGQVPAEVFEDMVLSPPRPARGKANRAAKGPKDGLSAKERKMPKDARAMMGVIQF